MTLLRPKPNNRTYPTLFLLVFYLLLTGLLTWPTVTQFATHLPGDGGDDPAIAWNLWWLKYALLNQPQNPFQTDFMFYPLGINLAFYTLTLLNGLIALPLTLNFGVVAASNLHLFFSFVSGGYGVFLLARYLLAAQTLPSSRLAWLSAAIAGLFYTFASSKLFYVALGQFNIASTHWIPFTILYMLRLHQRPGRLKNAVLAALFFTLQAWTEMTYASFLLIFLGIYWLYWGCWGLISRNFTLAQTSLGGGVPPPPSLFGTPPPSLFGTSPPSLFLKAIALLALLIGLGLSPILTQMLPDMRVEGDFLVEGSGFAGDFSADLVGFIVPTMHHPLWGEIVSRTGITGFDKGQHIYLGVILLGLALLAAIRFYRQPAFWFWGVAALLFALLCLGPTLRINGLESSLPGPFLLLQQLPFFKGNRYPSRFSVMLMLSLAVMAAFGLVQLGEWFKQRYRSPQAAYGLFSLLTLLFLFEHLSLPLPQSDMRVPAPYQHIAADPAEVMVLDIPFAWRNGFRLTGAPTTQFMFGQFYQTLHQKRLLQGNTSRNPEFKFQYFTQAPLLNSLLALETGKTLPPEQWETDRAIAAEALQFFGIKYIVVRLDSTHNSRVTPQATLPYIKSVLPVELIYEDAALKLYRTTIELEAKPDLRLDTGNPLASLYFGEGWGLLQPGQPVAAQRNAVRLMLPLRPGDYRLTFHLRLPEELKRQTLSLEMGGWRSPLQTVEPGQQALVFDLPATAIQPGLNDLYLHFDQLLSLPSPEAGTPPLDVTVVSAGEEVGKFGHIFVNGYEVSLNQRGYNLALIQPGQELKTAYFDTHADPEASSALSQYLASAERSGWPAGTLVAVAVGDEASYALGAEAVQALQRLGAANDLRGCFRCSYALLSRPGGPQQALEALDPLRPAAVSTGLGLTEPQIAALIELIQVEPVTPQSKN